MNRIMSVSIDSYSEYKGALCNIGYQNFSAIMESVKKRLLF